MNNMRCAEHAARRDDMIEYRLLMRDVDCRRFFEEIIVISGIILKWIIN